MLYSDKVMDHFRNPRNVGEIPDADGVGEVGNAKCGDIMKIYLKVKDGIISDVKFKTFGCGAAIAVSSMVSEMAKGKTLEEADKMTHLSFEPGDLALNAGDLVKVNVVIERKDDVLWLPPAAIRTFSGRNFVVVQDGDVQRRVDVTIGIQSTDRVEIKEGLEEGQIVVGQ